MCHFETSYFSGCGCLKPVPGAAPEECPIALAYGRICPDFQCGLQPKEQATERYGLVCLDCIEAKNSKNSKKSSKK
ncbi:hypothetical protein KVR01_010546 [Diaporthe batatas]|uniref:uncharacterized protein n=1 Tax=Diaporthe batatas TaxID=748121 RepID=UPI001D057570|nr:uncharacterized protein KVR01_010546 [Diaporthe batatas]KAG8159909.1 hypothetical protein KVR01_010546 [Diaporthe batatas]